jgi:hypothetical protein
MDEATKELVRRRAGDAGLRMAVTSFRDMLPLLW